MHAGHTDVQHAIAAHTPVGPANGAGQGPHVAIGIRGRDHSPVQRQEKLLVPLRVEPGCVISNTKNQGRGGGGGGGKMDGKKVQYDSAIEKGIFDQCR